MDKNGILTRFNCSPVKSKIDQADPVIMVEISNSSHYMICQFLIFFKNILSFFFATLLFSTYLFDWSPLYHFLNNKNVSVLARV